MRQKLISIIILLTLLLNVNCVSFSSLLASDIASNEAVVLVKDYFLYNNACQNIINNIFVSITDVQITKTGQGNEKSPLNSSDDKKQNNNKIDFIINSENRDIKISKCYGKNGYLVAKNTLLADQNNFDNTNNIWLIFSIITFLLYLHLMAFYSRPRGSIDNVNVYSLGRGIAIP